MLLIRCGGPPPDRNKIATTTDLKRILIKEEVGKGNYLSTSFGIYYDKYLYVPDQTSNRVFKLDANLEPVLKLGESGEGPGGLAGPNYVFVGQDRIFVDTGATQRISSFDAAGNFLNATPVGDYKRLTRFVAFDEFIFLSSPNREQPYSVVDMDGQFQFGFGTFRFEQMPKFKLSRNFNHLLLGEVGDQPILISIGLSEPEIDAFDLEGKRLFGFNYKDFPQVRDRLVSIEEFYQTAGPNQARSLITDACLFDHQIYILLYAHEKPFQILHFEVRATGIAYKETLMIRDNLFLLSMATDGSSFYFLEGRTNYLFVYQRGP